jgi:hypothetical protein
VYVGFWLFVEMFLYSIICSEWCAVVGMFQKFCNCLTLHVGISEYGPFFLFQGCLYRLCFDDLFLFSLYFIMFLVAHCRSDCLVKCMVLSAVCIFGLLLKWGMLC